LRITSQIFRQPSTDSVTPSFQDPASAGELKGDGGTNPDDLSRPKSGAQ
jgi:hypothetical protein